MELFLAADVRPFAIAAVMLFGLTAIEVLMLVVGISLSELVDKSFGEHGLSHSLSWLNVGGVPLMVLILLALACFAAAGFLIQALAAALIRPLPVLIAAAGAVAAAVPAVRWSSRQVARVVPRDETYAVELADFIGRTAEVTVGPLDQGKPGRVRLKDIHGNWHVANARAAQAQDRIPVGATVLLVDQAKGIFLAIPAPADLAAGPPPSDGTLER